MTDTVGGGIDVQFLRTFNYPNTLLPQLVQIIQVPLNVTKFVQNGLLHKILLCENPQLCELVKYHCCGFLLTDLLTKSFVRFWIFKVRKGGVWKTSFCKSSHILDPSWSSTWLYIVFYFNGHFLMWKELCCLIGSTSCTWLPGEVDKNSAPCWPLEGWIRTTGGILMKTNFVVMETIGHWSSGDKFCMVCCITNFKS